MNQVDKITAYNLYLDGYSFVEIAKILNCNSGSTVRDALLIHIRNSGDPIVLPHEKVTIRRRLEQELYAAGVSVKEIAVKVNVTETTVYNDLKIDIEEKHDEPLTVINKYSDIDELDLGSRAWRILRSNGVHTIEDLMLVTEDQLRCLRNCGQKTIAEIIRVRDDCIDRF